MLILPDDMPTQLLFSIQTPSSWFLTAATRASKLAHIDPISARHVDAHGLGTHHLPRRMEVPHRLQVMSPTSSQMTTFKCWLAACLIQHNHLHLHPLVAG